MKSIILCNLSNTQRTVANFEQSSVLFTKEWRKSDKDNWTMGKGVRVSNQNILNISEILKCEDKDTLDELLSEYETAGETYDNYKNINSYQKANNQRY